MKKVNIYENVLNNGHAHLQTGCALSLTGHALATHSAKNNLKTRNAERRRKEYSQAPR